MDAEGIGVGGSAWIVNPLYDSDGDGDGDDGGTDYNADPIREVSSGSHGVAAAAASGTSSNASAVSVSNFYY